MMRPDRYHQPWRRRLRWEQTPIEPWIRNSSAVVALCVTLLVYGGFHRGMPFESVPAEPRSPIQVDIIGPAVVLPLPEPPQPPPLVRGTSVPVVPDEVVVRLPEQHTTQGERATSARSGDAPVPDLKLFNADGSIRLPEAQAVPPPSARERARQEWAQLQQRGHNVIDCERTQFSDTYTPDESLGDGVARRYLSWIGLVDHEVLQRNAERRRPRHGCD